MSSRNASLHDAFGAFVRFCLKFTELRLCLMHSNFYSSKLRRILASTPLAVTDIRSTRGERFIDATVSGPSSCRILEPNYVLVRTLIIYVQC